MFLLGSAGEYLCTLVFARSSLMHPFVAGQAVSMLIVFACLIQNDPQIIKGSVFGLFAFLCFFGCTWLEVRLPSRTPVPFPLPFCTPVSFLSSSFADPRYLSSSRGCTPPRSTLSALVPTPTLSRPCPTGASGLAFRRNLCSRV